MTEVLTVDGARRVRVVDSHTGGEPTRVVTDGFPDLEGATLAERAADMAARHRRLATAIVDEPRGNEAMVGALLTPPTDPACVAGVIFFDNARWCSACAVTAPSASSRRSPASAASAPASTPSRRRWGWCAPCSATTGG